MTDKAWHTEEYMIVAKLLRQRRQKHALTQVDLAQRLGQSQSFISKIERGELRLDVVQLRQICQQIGCSFLAMMTELDKELGSREK